MKVCKRLINQSINQVVLRHEGKQILAYVKFPAIHMVKKPASVDDSDIFEIRYLCIHEQTGKLGM